MQKDFAGMRAAVPHIRLGNDSDPYIEGARCNNCHEVFVGARENCPKCGARGGMATVRLRDTGKVHTYSIVHRSFPGVATPFVSAIVALDGGGALQATIRDAPTDAATPLFNLPVRLRFDDSGQRDGAGKAFLAYYFVPATSQVGDPA